MELAPGVPFGYDLHAEGGIMATSPRVCVVGSANLDLTFQAPRLPRPGETLAGRGFHRGLGGKGANQAVMAARLSARVAFVAAVGDDPFGRECRERYRDEGIDTEHVRAVADRPTGVAAILVDDSGGNCIVVVPGANATLSPEDVRRATTAIQNADVVLSQLEVPASATAEAFRLARAAGVRTVLTPAPASDVPGELLQSCDLCLPNETEVAALTGLPTGNLDEVATAAARLRRLGPQAVIVTLGERGAMVLDEAGVLHVPAVPVRAVDTTGAGDAFSAAVAVFWTAGLSLREAAATANAVAAQTVTRPGAIDSFPPRA